MKLFNEFIMCWRDDNIYFDISLDMIQNLINIDVVTAIKIPRTDNITSVKKIIN